MNRTLITFTVVAGLEIFAFAKVAGQEVTGACCVANGGCQVVTAAECSALGGNYQGDGSTCTPNPCDCCGTDGTEMRGNADGIGGVNIVDVTYMIVRCFNIFGYGCPQACRQEVDVNASGTINIIDLTYLVAYLFHYGPPPAMCP